MPGLKDNIYKIMTITSINDASIAHDMQVIGFGIIWSRILLPKPDE
jgi:hypothetical protein